MQEQSITEAELELQLIEDIGRFTHNPRGYIHYAFPWGEEHTDLEDEKPRTWQLNIADIIGEHFRNEATRYEPCQIAVSSGHGIGKSALIGMVSKWALDTFEDTRIVCTANTEPQLRTKTVPEVTKWSHLSHTDHWFKPTATALISTALKPIPHDKSWRMDFMPWSKDRPESFAGLHNKRKRIVVIMDEASAIDDVIWETVEGALTDEYTEIIWIAFGNPTRNVGRFRECFRKFKKYWYTMHIDSRDVEGTNKKLFERWAEQYGEDSDFFRVRCMGQFPHQSLYQLFSTKDVDRAWGAHLREEQYNFAPLILSLDNAWSGEDEGVIAMRQGLYFDILETFPKNDNDIQVATRLAHYEDTLKADGVNIDGGYGTGVVSAGRTWGRHWNLIWFSDKSGRVDCINKRAEMYIEARDWLKDGGVIPKDQTLYDEMIQAENLTRMDGKFQIPAKEDVKEILGWSPGRLDALGLTHALPIAKKTNRATIEAQMQANRDYNPMTERLKRK